jgi:hypothetical protein
MYRYKEFALNLDHVLIVVQCAHQLTVYIKLRDGESASFPRVVTHNVEWFGMDRAFVLTFESKEVAAREMEKFTVRE